MLRASRWRGHSTTLVAAASVGLVLLGEDLGTAIIEATAEHQGSGVPGAIIPHRIRVATRPARAAPHVDHHRDGVAELRERFVANFNVVAFALAVSLCASVAFVDVAAAPIEPS